MHADAAEETPLERRTRPSGGAWHENAPRIGWLPPLALRELWHERELAVALAGKDVRVRYKQTFLGIVWALLQPLAAVALFSLVFGRAAGLPSDGLPYPVFAYVGLVLWLYVASSVTAASQSLVDNRDLVTKVYFPRLLAPFSALLPGLVDLAVSLPVLAIFLAAWSVAPGAAVLLLPLWIAWAVLVALGAGLLLGAANVRYRDVRHALPFLTQLWFFATPVVYPSSLVDGGWALLYAVNPMVGVIDGFRWSVASGPAPGADLAISASSSLVLLLWGYVYFRRVERSFADVI